MKHNVSYLGANLRRIRKAKGVTGVRLKCMSGVSRATISEIENGSTLPRIDTLQELANGLGVDIAELLQCPEEE